MLRLLRGAAELLWAMVMILVPALGVWLASSLVSLHGGPRELSLLGGVLLFPVLPALWELRATKKWKKQVSSRRQLGQKPRRKLTVLDRLALRTVFLNVLFLAALLFFFPKTAFAALATRGDWFLEGQTQPWANTSRQVLFAAATGLEWLHRAANKNPYEKEGDRVPVPTDVVPTEVKRPPVPPAPVPVPVPRPEDEPPPVPGLRESAWTVGDTFWPQPEQVHPVVAAMTAEHEGSLEDVARHIAQRVPDPFERVKALHDWVVSRLDYDQASLRPGQRKPQDAVTVFRTRLGVCEGYARLLAAMGKVTGDDVRYVVGEVREPKGELAASPHAWNAVRLRGQWYLVDATWDDPVSPNGERHYQTDYLFIPPQVAVFDHFPDETSWQLLAQPLSRGDFLRQPFARPGLAKWGLTLLEPNRPYLETDAAFDVRLTNPRRLHVSLSLVPDGEKEGRDCGVSDAAEVALRCEVEASGKYEARVYTNRQRYGTYGQVAAIAVDVR